MKRGSQAAYYVIPVIFCTALFWRGLPIWFVQDDFGWLGLRRLVTNGHGLLWALFTPLAQGTIRPWSERGFFLLFSSLFGLHPLPFRIFAFFNQFVNIVLVVLLARRLAGSALVGSLAALLWLANPALVTPMSWSSAYNEIQCATFLLLSLFLFIRFTETGKRGFLWAQYGAFILGFGSNELNAVHPAVAAVYAFLFARRHLKTTAPLFAVSALYVVADRLVAAPTSGVYAMNFHPGLLWFTFKQYVDILFSGFKFGAVSNWSKITGGVLTYAAVAGILAFAASRARKRDYVPAFGLCWFLLVLAPLLVLPSHISPYYLTVPAIGVAITGACAVARAWKSRLALAACATVLAGAYFLLSSRSTYQRMRFEFQKAERARVLVEGVAEVKRRDPAKLVLLDNVDEQLFWAVVYARPFERIFGWRDVLLTPESRALIAAPPGSDTVEGFFFPESAIRSFIPTGPAAVLALENGALHDTTSQYALRLATKPAPLLDQVVDIGSPYAAHQLGDGWYAAAAGGRWSARQATVFLPGPVRPNQKLNIRGWVDSRMLAAGPLHVAVTIAGYEQPLRTIEMNSPAFQFDYDLPAELVGWPRMEVTVAVDHTMRFPPDVRDLGLAFGQFSIR